VRAAVLQGVYMWEIRFFGVDGEPKSINRKGLWENSDEVEEYFRKIEPGCEFIHAVRV